MAKERKFPLAFSLWAAELIFLSSLTGTLGGLWELRLREESAAIFAWVEADSSALLGGTAVREDTLGRLHEGLKQARLAEEERQRLAEEERQRREEEERRRLEEELARQERENERAERARQQQEKRRAAAEEAAQEIATMIAEQEKAAQESNYRAEIAKGLKEQQKEAEAQQLAYLAERPEADVSLAVEIEKQNPELPNGCEATCLQALLAYKGVEIDKGLLADAYFPQFPFYQAAIEGETVRAGGDPELYFAGNPRDTQNAYYCFAGPVVTAANQVLAEAGLPMQAIDMTGADESDLTDLLDLGEPVIVWGTLWMGDAYTYAKSAWVIDEDTGEKHIPFLNLHAVVLCGYDFDYFYIADPIRGNVAVRRETLMNAYRQIGMRAVVIR